MRSQLGSCQNLDQTVQKEIIGSEKSKSFVHVVKHSSPHLLDLDFICLAPQITASREGFPLVLFTAAKRELVSSRETCSGNPGQNLGEIVMSSDLKPCFLLFLLFLGIPKHASHSPSWKKVAQSFQIFLNQKIYSSTRSYRSLSWLPVFSGDNLRKLRQNLAWESQPSSSSTLATCHHMPKASVRKIKWPWILWPWKFGNLPIFPIFLSDFECAHSTLQVAPPMVRSPQLHLLLNLYFSGAVHPIRRKRLHRKLSQDKRPNMKSDRLLKSASMILSKTWRCFERHRYKKGRSCLKKNSDMWKKNTVWALAAKKIQNHIGTTSMSCNAFGRQEELLSSQLVCF